MVIRQRTTRFDDFLLKVAFPVLHSAGLGKLLPKLDIWHESVPSRPALRIVSREERPAQVIPEARPYLRVDQRRAA